MSVLDRFEGRWALKRDIFDLDSNWTGKLVGEAVFRRVGDWLELNERGTLKFAGLQAMEATRRYLWTSRDGLIDVHFDDERFFHRFDPSLPVAEASHLCEADLYDVRYVFDDADHWRAEWRVVGPRKDYRMVSRHSR
ncbi:DUF6314 family protein [Pontivivens insulae]|uniref:DUF6314 domain-containing protein n=1 Tax=Pontivivens insulae TaxID=1639689 RepID=A0A2R8ABN2_9RHOB|nr:DUF6314 family protein [Pontivivens insulae]RED11342.1 hypothetical protein DFR53_3377 [Pontivivens insulae]SPF29485.1 hypothetical protein POI8812_01796 [Pontivivens insulae]